MGLALCARWFLSGGIILHPSKESGLQAGLSPESKLESEKEVSISHCRAERFKGENILIWKQLWLITTFKGGCCTPFSLSQWAQGVIWGWPGALTGLGMFTCVWGEQCHGFDLVWELTAQREQGRWECSVCACSVRCVTVLTPCVPGLSQASVGRQLPSKLWLADLFLNCWSAVLLLK